MTKIPAGLASAVAIRARLAPPDGQLIPGALADELLEGLIGVGDGQSGGQGGLAGHRLDALAVGVLEQAAEVDAAPEGLAGPVEVVAEVGAIGAEAVEDVGGEFGGVGPVHTLFTNRGGRAFVGTNGVALSLSRILRGHLAGACGKAGPATGKIRMLIPPSEEWR